MSLSSNPEARAYHLAANHRYEDAVILLDNRRTNGSIYLAGFAVECALKALIMANSTPKERSKLLEKLKKEHGHNLDALRKELARRGMHMPEEVIDAYRRLNTWHSNARYDPLLQSTRDAQDMLNSATLVRWVERIGGSGDG